MAFDGLVLAAVRRSLAQTLTDSRVDRVFQPRPDTIILKFRQEGQSYRLLLSANASRARAHLTRQDYPNPQAPPAFCMLLRKYLEGGRLLSVEQPGLERQLDLILQNRDETGEVRTFTLSTEIMGKHSNVILIDPARQVILDGIKRFTHDVNRYREILPGRPYLPPPAQDKLDPREITEEGFATEILTKNLDRKLWEALLNRFSGLGPIMAREIVFRAGIDLNYPVNQCGDYELSRTWQQLRHLYSQLDQGQFSPCLIRSPEAYLDFSAFTLTCYPPALREEYPDINAALDRFDQALTNAEVLKIGKENLNRVLKREIARCQKKASLQQDTVEAARLAEDKRLKGELLIANLYKINQGDESFLAENYYTDPPETLKIELKSNLSPAENAQVYFKQYNKAKQSAQKAAWQLEQTREELDYLESIAAALELASDPFDLEELKKELTAQGYLKPEKTPARAKKEEQGTGEPLEFRSGDGFQILVGKNNRQNDRLTLRLAKPDDLWLHTRNIPGSHVIISSGGRQIPDTTLTEAAVLAAYHSRARRSANVPVDYTEVKNVKKPRGARPGMVTYVGQHTLFVTPTEEAVQRIKNSNFS